MSKQPEALRLAGILGDAVEDPMIETHAEVSKALCIHAAAELRRQHALIKEMREALQWTERALDSDHPAAISARAALAKAEAQS